MSLRRMGYAGVVAAVVSGSVDAGQAMQPVAPVVDYEGVRSALVGVELNRPGIVERLVVVHGAAALTHGVQPEALRAALAALRADNLLVASLVQRFEDLVAIIDRQAAEQAALPLGPMATKDGAGSGASSWIGNVAGNNVASGTGSGVAAGTYNVASGTNAFVAAGQSNQAGGVSSLVIGGFDNRALGIDSLVGGGEESLFLRNVSVVVRSILGDAAINFAIGASSVPL
jgi:hypothetical protein